jgi:hypothetical protein
MPARKALLPQWMATSSTVGSRINRRFSLADNVERGGRLRDGCGHRFKATNGWSKAEYAAATKKAVDETGLMAVTCFHGIGVHYLHLYGGNERYTHACGLPSRNEDACVVFKRWIKTTEVGVEAQRVLDRIVGITVIERTDKSGHVHPEHQVSREYLDAQATDQVQF